MPTHQTLAPPKSKAAPQLMRSCAGAAQRASTPCGCSDCKDKPIPGLLQRAGWGVAADRAPPLVDDVLRAPGEPLQAPVRQEMEQRFRHDFSRVRVHADGRAADSAQAVNAWAYTVGRHVAFGRGRYAPATAVGRQLLAHELAHVVQQGAAPFDGDPRGVPIAPAGTAHEQQADRAADAVLAGRDAGVVALAAPASLARRGPMPVPVRPPMVRPAPPRPGTLAPGSAPSAGAGGYQAPTWVPEISDNSLDALSQRAAIGSEAERTRMANERPMATLERGGQPPDFVTEHGTRRITWMGGPAGGGSATVRVRQFHVLDAIEHEVARANTDADLRAVMDRYVPMVGLLDQAIELARGGSGAMATPVTTLVPMADVPVYAQGFDPRAETRLQVFEAAVAQRSQQVPTLANSRLRPKTRKQGGCRIEPVSPMGDDPMSSLYCHIATGSPLSYRITIENASGGATKRWAEIDALRGNTWYECKCGYEALVTGKSRGDKVAAAVLDKLDQQVLNHADIARTCGLDYRYIVSNNTVADMLRQRWFGNVVVNVVPFEGCE